MDKFALKICGFYKPLQIEIPLTDVIISREQVTIPSLDCQVVVSTWVIEVHDCPVVEASIAMHGAIVGVGTFLIFIVDM